MTKEDQIKLFNAVSQKIMARAESAAQTFIDTLGAEINRTLSAAVEALNKEPIQVVPEIKEQNG